jgi:hypothetical protein
MAEPTEVGEVLLQAVDDGLSVPGEIVREAIYERLQRSYKLDAVAAQNHRVLPHLEAAAVLFSHASLESFRLLLRGRVEAFVASLEFPLPRLVLTFDSFTFAVPVQNKFRVDCSLQLQRRGTHNTFLN